MKPLTCCPLTCCPLPCPKRFLRWALNGRPRFKFKRSQLDCRSATSLGLPRQVQKKKGGVYDPDHCLYLLAANLDGSAVTEALHVTLKLQKDGKSESQVRVALVATDCVSAIQSFFTASLYVLKVLGAEDVEAMAARSDFLASCRVDELMHVRTAALDVLEYILDLPEPDVPCRTWGTPTVFHALGVSLYTDARVARAFASTGYVYAPQGLVNVCRSDMAMGAATRACLLLSLDWSEGMPLTKEAQRRLGFFMKSLVMDMPSLGSIKEMRSFSVGTPFYAETVLFSLQVLNGPLVNHPISQQVEEEEKKVTILKYLTTIHERIGIIFSNTWT
ncbi:hypothetical protein PsorP6_018926 [Peronosclerospora sorghi]|nr:hypothetical protein PsorP6_018516 [Peronosclerospora sorghi]KAI9895300.1 hypothetical protein PsorP6_018926 [Peronosclerospora sorghi]